MTSRVATPPARTTRITARLYLPRGRVVVEAGQQQLVDGAADLVIRRLHQRQLQVARPVLDAVEVPRQPAVRRHDHDPAGVRVLPDRLVVGVPEADRARQHRDLRLVPGQEVPSFSGAVAAVPPHVVRLLRAGELRRIARIEAHRDDVEVLPDRKVQRAQRARQPVEHLGAEHRALEVVQRQDHRPAAEVVAELHGAAGLVLERQVQRNLRVQLLIEADFLQQLGHPRRRRHARADALAGRRAQVLGTAHRRHQRRKSHDEEDDSNSHHVRQCFSGAGPLARSGVTESPGPI